MAYVFNTITLYIQIIGKKSSINWVAGNVMYNAVKTCLNDIIPRCEFTNLLFRKRVDILFTL